MDKKLFDYIPEPHKTEVKRTMFHIDKILEEVKREIRIAENQPTIPLDTKDLRNILVRIQDVLEINQAVIIQSVVQTGSFYKEKEEGL